MVRFTWRLTICVSRPMGCTKGQRCCSRLARKLAVNSLFLPVTRYASATTTKTTCVCRSLQEKDFQRALPVTSGERCLWRVVEVLSPHLQDGHQSSRIPGIATNTTDPTIPSTHAANGLNDANRAVSNTINRLLGRGGLLAHDPTEKR